MSNLTISLLFDYNLTKNVSFTNDEAVDHLRGQQGCAAVEDEEGETRTFAREINICSLQRMSRMPSVDQRGVTSRYSVPIRNWVNCKKTN